MGKERHGAARHFLRKNAGYIQMCLILYNILHIIGIYTYIIICVYMSRDPHTPPQPDGSPPLWQGRGGFLSSQAMMYVVFSAYNAYVSIIRMDILYVI